MTIKVSDVVKNAELDAIETAIGATAILLIRSGAAPTNITDTDTGTVLATINLPADWMAAASGGTKALAGTWSDTDADATGTAAHFRLYSTDGVTQHMQGTVTVTSDAGDLTLDNVSINATQTVNVTTFTWTAGN
jgi:hypothetical protein